MRLYFSTPVWGKGHIELFQTVGLPSLLAPGNLPAVTDPAECRYFIYTRASDLETLKDSEAFRRLEALIPVEVRLVPEPIEVPHHTMSWCHADTLRRADEDDVAAVFLPPDCVWSDGSLRQLQALADSGKSVVHISGVRLNRDTVLPALEQLGGEDGTLSIKPQALVDLGLKHLHTIAVSHFWGEREGGLLPANLYWSVPGQGLLLRCFHLHPLMVKSQVKFASFAGTIDDDLALSVCPDPSTEYVVTDSDEILTFEISAPTHQAGAPFPKSSIESVAAWAEIGTNERHRELSRHVIRLHHTPTDPKVWAPVEAEADRVMRESRRINDRPTLMLALTNPKVFAWRGYAMSLGKGRYSGRRSAGWDWLRRAFFARVPWARSIAFKFLR
jgi:hypothetical protein